MYNDFPTVYETSLNQNIIYYIILGIILLIILLITLISLAKVFKKANRSGISAIIPIYNIITLLEITNSSKWYLLFLLIPIVNIFFALSIMFSLAKTFKKSKIFGIGLTFLPFIFYPILAFGKSEYIGIDIVAMNGKTIVADIPKVVESNESQPMIHEEEDTSSKNINISIGGGVYQKDYTNTLLQVDKNQVITPKNVDFIEKSSSLLNHSLNDNTDSSKLSFIVPVEEEIKPEEEPKDISIDFANQINAVKKQKESTVKLNDITSNFSSQNSVNSINNASVSSEPLIEKKKIEVPTFTTNPETQPSVDSQLQEKSEFISCPKCGAKIKGDVKACFLCGKRLD